MLKDLLHIAFPALCVGCNNTLLKGEHHVCIGCDLQLNRPYALNELDIILDKLIDKTYVNTIKAYLYYDKKGLTQAILHQIKYNNNQSIARYYGSLMGKELNELNYSPDLMIPVPLHPKKMRQRGFNQSEVIVNGLLKELNSQLDYTSLVRERYTETQTKKTKQEREQNVLNAFSCSELKEAKRILLVDDVTTTGVTLNECAKAIKKNNPHIIIDVLCLAFAKI